MRELDEGRRRGWTDGLQVLEDDVDGLDHHTLVSVGHGEQSRMKRVEWEKEWV